MSDLQLALAGAAILIALLVMGYNHWQEAKHKKRVERAFGGTPAARADALMGERLEPHVGQSAGAPRADDIDEGKRAPLTDRPLVPASPSALDRPMVHGQIDTVALVLANEPLSVERIWPAIERTRGLGEPVHWEGLVAGVWHGIDGNTDDGAAFRELRAGLQLASRKGATSPSTIRAFDRLVADFAAATGAVSQREDVAAAERRALEVDRLCAETDIEIAINLIGRNGATFATAKVCGLAEALGFVALASGEFQKRDALGHVEYGLRNMNADEPSGIRQAGTYLTGLTFALDVPRTLSPVATFERMMGDVLRFADALGGEVVDDNRRPLTATGRKLIAKTIQEIEQTMDAREIVPGSAVALRLYS